MSETMPPQKWRERYQDVPMPHHSPGYCVTCRKEKVWRRWNDEEPWAALCLRCSGEQNFQPSRTSVPNLPLPKGGHRYSPDLVCVCGAEWAAQRLEPSPCPKGEQ
jgi:hypothetical protein